jgi:hypothetical protein
VSTVAAEAVITDAESARKRVATARARLALVGVMLRETEADNGRPTWIAIEGALTRSFDGVVKLERWVDLRTGRRDEAGT